MKYHCVNQLVAFILCCLALQSLYAATIKEHQGLLQCEYEGQVYSAGSKFNPDHCTRCRCKGKTGNVECAVEDCAPELHCRVFKNSTGQCCPSCEQYGCRHSSGKLYEQGELIRNEPCVRCYCPLGGGNPVCDVTDCPLSQCVDPVQIPGVCCPVCPKGPNCQIGLLTLPVGQSVSIEGATCTCETFEDMDGEKRTMARCNKG